MGIAYQLTFFLGLALLGVVITIFVFAVAQLGRATEVSSRETQAILSREKETRVKRIESIEKQLAEAKKTGSLDYSKLSSELQNLIKERIGYEAELKRIHGKLECMRVKGGVLRPGAFFFTTLILSGLATFLAGGQNDIANALWISSIVTLGFGSWWVYKNLKVIEEVTTTSQEAMEKLPEAVKVALRELEEEKKPELALVFEGEQLPLHITCGGQIEAKYYIFLVKGEVARSLEVAFFAPPGFDFPGVRTWLQPQKQREIGGYTTTSFGYEDLRKGIIFRRRITLKAPSSPGSFTLKYSIVCERFDSGFEEFEVVVE